MFLHLGADVVVPLKDVIAILDYETGKESMVTREFLTVVEEEGFVRDISEGASKSFVVTSRYVFLSPISSVTLAKRAATTYGLPEEVLGSGDHQES